MFDSEDEVDIYNAINANSNAAQYYFPTPSDSANVKPEGLAQDTLADVTIAEQSAPCFHGYFNRGDLENPDVAACVDFTYSEMKAFFEQYL